jgi:hypothetical protein
MKVSLYPVFFLDKTVQWCLDLFMFSESSQANLSWTVFLLFGAIVLVYEKHRAKGVFCFEI